VPENQVDQYDPDAIGYFVMLFKYLNAHHKDGAKYNNPDRNLELLQIRCHASEFMRWHTALTRLHCRCGGAR
jgi:hypothetical protein